jgi:hypothetical protein
MPSGAPTTDRTLGDLFQDGTITKAQFNEAKKRGYLSYFITREGRLVLITPEKTVYAIKRDGKLWEEYAYHGKIKKRAFR